MTQCREPREFWEIKGEDGWCNETKSLEKAIQQKKFHDELYEAPSEIIHWREVLTPDSRDQALAIAREALKHYQLQHSYRCATAEEEGIECFCGQPKKAHEALTAMDNILKGQK